MAAAAGAAGGPALHLHDLPDPILRLIFSLVSDPRSRNSISLCCRRWLDFDRDTRTRLSLRGSLSDLRLPPHFPAVADLDLSRLSPWGHPDLLPFFPFLALSFPAVTSLTLYASDLDAVDSAAQTWPALRRVKLVRYHQRPAGLPHGADLVPLLAHCTRIAELDLSEFYCWTEDVAPALSAYPCSSLASLDLRLAGATDGFRSSEIESIAAACPNLQKLVAPCLFNPLFIQFVGDSTLLTLATACPKLAVLRLTDPSPAPQDDAAVTAAGLVEVFAQLPNLEDLAFDLQHKVRDAAPAFEALARRCRRIKHLSLGGFQGVCKAAWLHLDGVAVCGGLESLHIKRCADITDAGLASIGRGCTKLSKFGIESSPAVTAAGIHKLAAALHSTLADVAISRCELLDTAGCLRALRPIRDRILRLHIDCVWSPPPPPDSAEEARAAKRPRNASSEHDWQRWERLQSLSLWLPAGELLSPLASSGLEECPALEEVSIKVEGDCRQCPRPAPHVFFGLSVLGRYRGITKMKLDLGEATGYALTAPAGQMDLSLWERFYLKGIELVEGMYELDYWPPQDRDMNQRSLSLPAAGLLQGCARLRKLFIHGTAHEHFMGFFLQMPNLRDVQLREDYYPAPEDDMSTEMRPESWLRFEGQLNSRPVPD